MPHKYFVYITTNKYRTVLYIGVTNNIIQRIEQHKLGEIDGFTKNYQVNILIYYEEFQYIDRAILREKQLKGWTRKKKLQMIIKNNSDMRELVYDQL